MKRALELALKNSQGARPNPSVGAVIVSENKVIGGTGGFQVDNITIDGTEIDLSSGDLTLDVEGDIDFDANGGNFKFSDDVVIDSSKKLYLYDEG